ncbi:MAG: ribose 5-phosphate isomerase B [Clostridia bacterium]
MKIAIGCDHGGYDLKESLLKYLIEQGNEVKDFGSYDGSAVDYPQIGADVGKHVVNGKAEFGVLICSTGIGISISANKVKGVRAALCAEPHSAEMTRRHNNANVICFGGHMVSDVMAKKMLDIFLTTEFEGGRHQRRIDLITDIEEGKL